MGLFKKFNETIFYKQDSELEQQLEVLKKLNSEFPNNDDINRKIRLCELGIKGENEIEFELKNSNIGMFVLHDVNMKYEDLTAQIDYIVITSAYIYFIECKNLIGNITINDRGEFIREYTYNGKKIKEGFYSPIRQSERHIEIFKKIWLSRNNKLINKLQYKNFDSWCKYLVVMTNPKNILNVKYAPKELKNMVIRSDNLVKYLENDIIKKDKSLLSNEKEMLENAEGFMNNYNINKKKDYEKEFRAKFLNYSNNDILKNRLIEYRKTISKSKNIPAYYVFNNNELDKLLEYKPKNCNELKNLNILTDIKLKLYGEDIIRIVNSKEN